MQDWKFLAKNFDDVSNEIIARENLLRLDVYILVSVYLKEGKPHFIKIIEENNEELNINNAKKEFTISDLKNKAIKKGLRKEKKDA